MTQKQKSVDAQKIRIKEKVEEIPFGVREKLKMFIQYIKGKIIFVFLSLFNKGFVLIFSPLSEHLEKNIFPELREKRVNWLTIELQKDNKGNPLLKGTAEVNHYEFPGTEKIALMFERYEIQSLKLNTQLESNQIIESILIYLYTKPYRSDAAIVDTQFNTWKRREIAAQMFGKSGYHRFCADMQYDKQNKTYQVDYTYCELFMSKVIKGYAISKSKYGDHRAFFAATPFVVAFVIVTFTLPVFLLGLGFKIWPVVWIAVGILPVLCGWFTLQAFGSTHYDKEHIELLNKEYRRQEKILAQFPETNPNPIIKIDQAGKIIYSNPAVYALLNQMKLDENEINEILPSNYCEIIKQSLNNNTEYDLETKAGDTIIRYLITSFKEDRSAIFAGSDITHLRKIEEELKEINQHLEYLVNKRTQELHTTQDISITSLAGLAEVRDPETGEHIERTRLYVKALAQHLKSHSKFGSYLTDDIINQLYKSAPLHDIGKVGIQDAILLKPGKLTDEEFEIMKKHASYGEITLKKAAEKLGFNSFLDLAAQIAGSHHEKWNGKGYPRGLKENEIPLSARLMALADVYDALINKRIYKPAFSHDKAKSIILAEKGQLFDPDVVDAFLQIENKFVQIAASLPNTSDETAM